MAEKIKNPVINELFEAGAHFGFLKSRRHPSNKPYIFGNKNNIEIFDLEKTKIELEKAEAFLEQKGRDGAMILFVGGKAEAREGVRSAGQELGQPFVAGRWIGGTLTNFNEIKKRIQKLEELTTAREKGELGKYTKKERLLIDREIAKLEIYFSGLSTLKSLPKALVIVDPKKESIALLEARRLKIPVVGITGSDNNINDVEYPIPSNDASQKSISLIMKKLVAAYNKGKSEIKKD